MDDIPSTPDPLFGRLTPWPEKRVTISTPKGAPTMQTKPNDQVGRVGFTPGLVYEPEGHFHNTDEFAIIADAETLIEVARCYGPNRVQNATLFAAAPELLAALEKVDDAFGDYISSKGCMEITDESARCSEACDNLKQIVRAALARATP